MQKKTNISLGLSLDERARLRDNKIKKSEIVDYAVDELSLVLNVSKLRAKEIYALADFQRVPSIGLEFAKDLFFLGYYTIDELKGKNGAELTDLFEKKKRFKTDPCVEDQFRLVVHFAENPDYIKNWWDFTSERKAYRKQHGYPADRPEINWTMVQNYK